MATNTQYVKESLDLFRKELIAWIENLFDGLATDNQVELENGINLFSHHEVPRTLRGLEKKDGKLIAIVESYEEDDENDFSNIAVEELLELHEALKEIALATKQ